MEAVQGGVPPYGVKETLVVNGKLCMETDWISMSIDIQSALAITCSGSMISNRIMSEARYSQCVAVFSVRGDYLSMHHECSRMSIINFTGRHFKSPR